MVTLHDDQCKTVNVRCHRGSLYASMETCQTIPANKKALMEYFFSQSTLIPLPASNDEIKVLPYSKGDVRIGWKEVYIVILGSSPIGFTDGPIQD